MVYSLATKRQPWLLSTTSHLGPPSLYCLPPLCFSYLLQAIVAHRPIGRHRQLLPLAATFSKPRRAPPQPSSPSAAPRCSSPSPPVASSATTVSFLRISAFTRPEQPPSLASVAIENDLFHSSPPFPAASPRQGTSITARRAPPDVAPLPSSAESLFLSSYTARPLPHLLVIACLQVFFRSIQPVSRPHQPRVLLASVQCELARSIAKKPVALPCFIFTTDLLPSSPRCGPKHAEAFV